MRGLLYEAAQVMINRVQKWSWLKAWALNVAKRRGLKKAIVALARRLAIVMHRIWWMAPYFDGRKTPRRRPPNPKPHYHVINRRPVSNLSSAARRKDVLRGTMDEVSSLGLLCRSRLA